MIKLVVFDLDGTLVDTVESIAKTANTALNELGYAALPISNFKFYAGDGVGELLKRVIRDSHGNEAKDYDLLHKWYLHYFPEYACYHVEVYLGVRELLSSLVEKKIRLGVYTNKPQHIAEQVLRSLFPEFIFDFIIGQSEGQERKPSPKGVLDMMEALELERKEVLYVGDTDTDMQTGKNAGVKTIGVLWGFRDREELETHGADVIVEKAEEILDYLY